MKWIEVVSGGIGTLYRPRSIRKGAEAEAYRIKTIAEAKAEAATIESLGQTHAQIERITLLSQQNPELVERAKARLLTREIEGQLNVEAIVENAVSNLPEAVSETPVSDDWRRRFFLEAENVCDHDLQIFWGKVLAGEVASPGRYSLRTLEVLKRLSKNEAELFCVATRLVASEGALYLPGDHNSVAAYGLGYGSLMVLREAGLLHEGDSSQRDFSAMPPHSTSTVIVINGVWIQIEKENLNQLRLPVLVFTQAGRDCRG